MGTGFVSLDTPFHLHRTQRQGGRNFTGVHPTRPRRPNGRQHRRELGVSGNAVYLARNRVLTRVRAELAGLFD